MGGTVLMAMMAFGGLNIQDKVIHIDPAMPDHWRSISFRFLYRGNEYKLKTDSSGVYLASSHSNTDGTVIVRGKEYKLSPGQEVEFRV
jgi:trehalose/maltose hydrolase-like predicted phosphorylase